MQETFLRAFCSIETAGEELLPWLLRGARNLYLDTWRWEKRMRPQKGHVKREDAGSLLYAMPGMYYEKV